MYLIQSIYYCICLELAGRALEACAKLSAHHLIISEHSRFDIYQKVMLNVSIDDLHYGLKALVDEQR